MSNTRSCHFESDYYNSRDIIYKRHHLYKNLMYEAGVDPQLFRTTSLHMIEGTGPKYLNANLFIRTCALHNNIEAMFSQGMCFCNDNFDVRMTLLRQAANEDHFEAIYLLGMIYISRGPPQCDQDMYALYVH
uniref:At2g35280-like TPR domain-containing protein n=1 Tax=Lactuca sativa TaxID=4236 RepID=A0A9R1XV56_LACSA|nr:hypothetical protein LSAT_V11C200067960 [Lactuca sativa]